MDSYTDYQKRRMKRNAERLQAIRDHFRTDHTPQIDWGSYEAAFVDQGDPEGSRSETLIFDVARSPGTKRVRNLAQEATA